MKNRKDNVSESNRNSKKMKNLLQLKRDNKGAAMVMVLVIIMLISILAAVLMFVSYLGYQMRLMDKTGKDTFYTAETVLDEINTGLQEEASAAMSKAYNDVMVNYAIYDSTVMRSSEFYRTYIKELKTRLQGTKPDGECDLTLLRSWLSDEALGKIGSANPDADGSRAKFDTFGAIVESIDDDELCMMDTKDESITIKDLQVTYVSPSGYVSIISTDIKLVLPSVSFAQASELPKLEKFSLIADETLAMGNVNGGGSVKIMGNAYAGRMTVGKIDGNPAKDPATAPAITDPGFLPYSNVAFEAAPGATPGNLALVINRENTIVNDSSTFTTDNVEFWGENIQLLSSDTSLNGITNLKDDLVLEGNGSEAKLAGEYNGFSMLTKDSSGSPAPGAGGAGGAGGGTPAEDEPALSSAIIVNGRESKLDLSGLDSMTIAGRSYVQTKTAAGSSIPAQYQNQSNIMMAESVAVKSNQLIYLAPAEAIGCVIENDGTIGETAYGANPLTLGQYEEIVGNPDKYLLLNGNKQIAALGYKPLSNYIEQVQVQGQTEKAYMPEVIFKKPASGGETLVYCYLKFTDEEKANYYFEDYYNVNAEQVDKYTKLYAKEIKMPDPAAMLYLNLAGNMLVYNEGQTTSASVISAPDDGNSSYYIKQLQAKTIYSTKTDAFKALSAKMVTNITQLTTVEQERHAFANIINSTKMDEMLAASLSDTLKIETGAAGNIKTAIFTKKPDITIDASTPSPSVIVTTGNVEVVNSFKGLIIAAGNVTVKSSGAEVKIEPMDIKDFAQILDAEVDIGTNKYYVIDAFRDGINYKSNTNAGASTESVALTDLIVYEKWSKR